MNEVPAITLDPSVEFVEAIYAIFGEWTDHVQTLIEEKGKDLPTTLSDGQEMQAFMRRPLINHWKGLTEVRQIELKRALQYFLNHDESYPYVLSGTDASLRAKEGGRSQKIRDNCQDALTPYDAYQICQWMWEILFSQEDWRTDISKWAIYGIEMGAANSRLIDPVQPSHIKQLGVALLRLLRRKH